MMRVAMLTGLGFTLLTANAMAGVSTGLPKCNSDAVRKVVAAVVGQKPVATAGGFAVSRWRFGEPITATLSGPSALVSHNFTVEGELALELKNAAKGNLRTVTCEFRRPAKFDKWSVVPANELIADGSYRRAIAPGKASHLRFDDEEDPNVDDNRIIVVLVDAPANGKTSFSVASTKAPPSKVLAVPHIVTSTDPKSTTAAVKLPATPATPPTTAASTSPATPAVPPTTASTSPATPAVAATPETTAPVVAPVETAAVSASANGKLVLDIAQTMHGRPYCWLLSGKAKGCKGLSIFSHGNNGYLGPLEATTVEGKGKLYAPDSLSGYGTYCSSYTFQVALRAADKLGLLSKLTKKQVEQWRVMWFGASSASVDVDGKKHSAILEQSVISLPAFKLGKRLGSLSEAQPGDFVQINRNDKGAGHSVIFVDYVRDSKGRSVGFKYIAANETNGVSYAQACYEHDSVPNAPELKHAEDEAYTTACKGSSTADFDRLYAARLGN